MAGALFYQSRQRRRVAVAFGVAALIHLAAVALAGLYHPQLEEVPPGQDEIPVVGTLESPFQTDTPAPPTDLPKPSSSPIPSDDSFFPVEGPTPPLVRQHASQRTSPVAKGNNGITSRSLGLASTTALALRAPPPEYPYEARRHRITGTGTVVMTVDPSSGNVTDAVMEQSTGSSVLDNATITAFRRWRFKPGTRSRVKCPITFTLTGVQY